MGIRVHKMIGYGLTDVKVRNDRLADPRINASSPLLSYEEVATLDGYLEWLEANGEPSMETGLLRRGHSDDRRDYDPNDAVVHRVGCDGGLGNVLAIRPVWLTDWYRSSDDIDWVEETYLRPERSSQRDHVKVLKHGLYPFSGSYMDSRDGRRLPPVACDWVRLRYSKAKPDQVVTIRTVMDEIAVKQLGFDSGEQALEHIVPEVPKDIRHLVTYGELFTDDTVWTQLRPLHYVWWC